MVYRELIHGSGCAQKMADCISDDTSVEDLRLLAWFEDVLFEPKAPHNINLAIEH